MKFDKRKDINPKYLLLALTIICVGLFVYTYFAGEQLMTLKSYTTKFITPIQQGINKIGVWTDTKMKNIQEIEALNKKNEELQEEIVNYQLQITNYQNQLLELQSLQDLYELDEAYPDYQKTGAHVFAKDGSSWFSVFYIDKGSKDDLFKGANVMCQDGLAGIVIECYDDYSKVRSIIDDETNISARIMPSNALCTVEGNLNQFDSGYIIVKNIDKDANIAVGDKVVTSNISDRFHPGLTIGYVSELHVDSNNLTVTAYVTPAVDFTNIMDVLVITDQKEHVIE